MDDHHTDRRFERRENGKVTWADYELKDGILSLLHVEADPSLRGTGAAGRLMEDIATHARERSLKIHPVCTYAAAWLKKHREHADLLE
ncbi:MAG: GNAT family N-acetyltransferase [Chthoniobacterales bacterium]